MPGSALTQEGEVPAAPAQPALAPPAGVEAYDTPDDAGGSITVEWKPSPDDTGPDGRTTGYEVFRSESRDSGFESITCVPGGATSCVDNSAADGVEYYYRVRATAPDVPSVAAASGPVTSSRS